MRAPGLSSCYDPIDAISRVGGIGGNENFMTEEEDLYVRASNSMINYLPPGGAGTIRCSGTRDF